MKLSTLFVGATAFAISTLVARAETLTAVPMQGMMVMPMVAYHADEDHLHVMMPMEIPQLTPLLISNPNDGFDPADPWYTALDPKAQGAAFSRRYGFVMDSMTDPLPANRQMWIRKLSGSPELKVYAYSGNNPKMLQPIFGTDGTPAARAWNGMMFHPVFAAPPATNELHATFEVYLIDPSTGQTVPDSSSGPLEFVWTNVSDGRPALSIATRVVVAWPADTASNWVLESTDTLGGGTWSTVTNSPVLVDGQPAVVLEGAAAARYFRMRSTP